jgi:hypothetical protein
MNLNKLHARLHDIQQEVGHDNVLVVAQGEGIPPLEIKNLKLEYHDDANTHTLWFEVEEREVRKEDVLVGTLASAYTLLALVPYDNWSHEGNPAEMAAYVVQSARERGNLGFLFHIFDIDHQVTQRVRGVS